MTRVMVCYRPFWSAIVELVLSKNRWNLSVFPNNIQHQAVVILVRRKGTDFILGLESSISACRFGYVLRLDSLFWVFAIFIPFVFLEYLIIIFIFIFFVQFLGSKQESSYPMP
jgi:hypothetical protein